MSKTLTRAGLANIIYQEIGISFLESSNLVDIFFDALIEGIKNNSHAKIPSFGSFYVREKKERIGRNPRTKLEAKIVARRVVSFYASNILKELINKS